MGFSFKVASRFLISNKIQTLLIIVGIAIGVSVQIFIGSLINGLQKDLVEKTVGSSPHITISLEKDSEGITEYNDKIDRLLNYQDIKNVSVSVDKNAFLKTDSDSYPILMRGLDIDKASAIYKINDRIIEGTKPNQDNEIMIGKDLQKEINAKIGDKYQLITPEGNKKDFIISGIYDLKVSSINKLWAITNIKSVQDFFEVGDKVTSIEIQVKNVFEADNIAKLVEDDSIFSSLQIQNWKAQNEQLLSGLSGQSISSIMIQVFVMISVVLGISSVLAISVSQKSKQIGILKAMGLNNFKSSLIFLLQGVILGIFGAALGILFGLGLSWSFTKFAVNPDGTPVVALYINTGFIILSGIIAIIASSVASIIPAISSSKLEPMEVIRNG